MRLARGDEEVVAAAGLYLTLQEPFHFKMGRFASKKKEKTILPLTFFEINH